MALHTTPENFRAEISRHMLVRKAIADKISMHPNQFTNYVNGNIPLPGWAAHNIGMAMNDMTGMKLFDVRHDIGYLRPEKGRPSVERRTWVSATGMEPYLNKKARRTVRRVKRRAKLKAEAASE